MKLASLNNVGSQEINDSDQLERNLLKLSIDKWKNPLGSAAVQSGSPDTSGGPEKSESEIGDEGEASRDKDTNQK